MENLNYGYKFITLDAIGSTSPQTAFVQIENVTGEFGLRLDENSGGTIEATINGIKRIYKNALIVNPQRIPTDKTIDLAIELKAIAGAGNVSSIEITYLTI